LANANLPRPYLLVGASFGGLLISTFAARYPEDVAGLVYFDALAPGSAEGYLQLGPLPSHGTVGEMLIDCGR
jgi:pimeloyl-ACP methyl ester carboxylesterase